MELADPVKRTLGNYERHNPGTRRTSSSPRPRRRTLGRRGQDLDGVFLPKCAIRDGGGSIIGRNTFQRPKAEAIDMLNRIIKIYQGKD